MLVLKITIWNRMRPKACTCAESTNKGANYHLKDTTWTQQQGTESHTELVSFLPCSYDVFPALTPLFVGFGLESCLTVGWLVMVLPLKAGVPTAGHLYHPGGQWSDCWPVVWLLAICIIHVVSGVTVGYLYHPGSQWCDCWPSVSSR